MSGARLWFHYDPHKTRSSSFNNPVKTEAAWRAASGQALAQGSFYNNVTLDKQFSVYTLVQTLS